MADRQPIPGGNPEFEQLVRAQNQKRMGDTPVFVPPGVNPSAAAYNARLAAKTAAKTAAIPGLQRYTDVPGGPSVPIPRLDAQPVAGPDGKTLGTMAQQAEHINHPTYAQMQQSMAQAAQSPNSIVEPSAPSPFVQPRAQRPQQLAIQPGDQLPPEAVRDPDFRGGPGTMGAMVAANQPHLAARYGVVRGNQRITPAQLAQGNQPKGPDGRALPRSFDAMLHDMQAAQNAPRMGMPRDDAEAEAQVKEKLTAPQEEKPLTEEERQAAKEKIQQLDNFDYDRLRQMMTNNVIYNPQQREIIEARLQPLDIEDLIMKDRVSQVVPIIPNKFWVKFTSTLGSEDLHLKRLLMLESNKLEVTERYLQDKFTLMTLACGLTAVNNNPAPTHINAEGKFDDGMFWKKFDWTLARGFHMLASLCANYEWFEHRVRKLFVAEKVGNG